MKGKHAPKGMPGKESGGTKTVGIIGGMGPMATVHLMQRIVEMTDARKDQEHIPMLVYHLPQIPDRTAFLEGRSRESPVLPIQQAAIKLEEQGADLLVIPCVTAHAFLKSIQHEVSIPVMNAAEECSSLLQKSGVAEVGILATDGALRCEIFQSTLYRKGIRTILPSERMQHALMRLIYSVLKAGKMADTGTLAEICNELKENGAQAIVLGCTELSLIWKEQLPAGMYLDAIDVMARRVVESCGRLKDEYRGIMESTIEGGYQT